MPDEWKMGVVHPLQKRRQMDCIHYRGITHLNVTYKILSNLIYKRLEPYADRIFGEYESEFRHNRSPIDHILPVRNVGTFFFEFNIV